jgi:hypothetical protein
LVCPPAGTRQDAEIAGEHKVGAKGQHGDHGSLETQKTVYDRQQPEHAPASAAQAAGSGLAAPILDIAALPVSTPTHNNYPQCLECRCLECCAIADIA